MIASLNNQSAPMPRVMTAASNNNEAEERKQILQKRSAELREFLKNSPDTVEISDKARALSEAARELTEINKALAADNSPDAVFNKTTVANAEEPAAASGRPVGTREERIESAKDYNEILEDLRSEYGEEEAMRRFDKIMKDDGYELVPEINHNGAMLPSMRNNLSLGVTMPPNGQKMSTSNLQTSSTVRAAMGANGEMEYLAETHANYSSYLNQDVQDALTGVYEKNMAEAQKGASFDLRAYMSENFGAGQRTSAVSASAELGTIAQNLLREAGVELGADGRMSFSLNEDGSLYVSGAFDEEEQAAIDAVLKRDPGIAKAFKAEYDSVAMTDTSDLAGAYNNGTRSVEYGAARRSFTYSASEPSAVVMTDSIGVRSSGYNYRKKVSDSFDINADNRAAVGSGVNLVTLDFEYAQNVNSALQDKLNEAALSGEAIESTITQSQYDSMQKARGGDFAGSGPNADGLALGIPLNADGEFVSMMHYPAGSPEAEQRVAEAKQALLDLAADPERRDEEIAYIDEQREARKATAAQLIEMFEARRNAPGTEMTDSIMEALARLRRS